MPKRPLALATFVRDQHKDIFAHPWPVIPSAFVLGALNVFLFAFDRPWTASDGIRNWGDWLFHLVGIIPQPELLSPFLYSGSVLNLGLLLGGLSAALLSREFGIKPAPIPELAKGALGGLLMGTGAVLSFGCNIGGFFSALAALSLSGIGMMLGLVFGSFLGSRYLIWENRRAIAAGKMPFTSACEAPPRSGDANVLGIQPLVGILMLGSLVGISYMYSRLELSSLSILLLFGVAFGVVLQRSRFCLVRAFREPFMSGESEHARAAALALVLSLVGFSILKAMDLKDASDWVFPSFWLGAVLGGTLFGVGMLMAGGCGAGSIWRAGEGHVKLWIAVLFFAAGASLARLLLVRTELIRELGEAVFIPSLMGWSAAISTVIALLILWYLVTAWIEQRKGPGLLRFK